MRDTDNSPESIYRNTLDELTKLMGQIAETDALMGKIFKRIATSGGKAPLCELSLAEIHFLSAVGKFAPINGAMLTQEIGLTKGGVSKMAARLASKGMIESERIEGNRKSQYFVLTADGKSACAIHAALHGIANDRIITSLSRYGTDEMTAFNGILKSIVAAVEVSSSDISTNFREYLADAGIQVD